MAFVKATLLCFSVVCNVLLIRLCLPEDISYNSSLSKAEQDTTDGGVWKKVFDLRIDPSSSTLTCECAEPPQGIPCCSLWVPGACCMTEFQEMTWLLCDFSEEL